MLTNKNLLMVEMLERAGLNWNVRSEEIRTESGLIIPDRIALVREDNNHVLGVHTKTYVPYQNDELLELLFKISTQTGLQLHTGGSFKGGKRVWFQLKSDDLKIGTDTIKGYISGFNSFDGSTALAFGNSSLTVSCQNSFFRGYREVGTRLRHSISMKPRIEEIIRKIDVLMDEEKKSFEEIIMLGNTKLTSATKELATMLILNIEDEEKLASGELSERKKNNLVRFENDLSIELSDKGQNLWGLFSGVTRYTTHSMKKGDNSESKMFGRTGSLERQVYRELLQLV